MKNALAITALALTVAGCPEPAAQNPAKLWLFIRGSERVVQLVPYEPQPY